MMRPWIKVLLRIAAVAAFAVTLPVLVIIDCFGHGPYCSWYNQRCQELADRAHLVGRPVADIPLILGPPSSIWDYGHPEGTRKTYNYDPWGLETGMFQVHCRGGVVAALEQFDD